MHGQCPSGGDSWCKYQKSLHDGSEYSEVSPGLPNTIINIVKPVYLSLCDKDLLSKYLHGLTQNANESFNAVLWNLLPKRTFVELQTLKLGGYIAVILLNSGFSGLLPVFESLGISINAKVLQNYSELDNERIEHSKRFSLPAIKIARKKGEQLKNQSVAKLN